jgi:hypothetical protein
MKQTIVAIVLTVALALGIAGVVLAVVGMTRANSQSRAIASLKVEVAQLQGQAALMDTTSIQNQLRKLAECVPEMQAQIDGLNVSSGYYTNPVGFNGSVASYPVTLNNPTLISQNCRSVLRPQR